MKTKDLWRPFFVIGLTWIAVVLVSWWVIPAWRREPGDFWILLGFAAPGVLSIAKDLIGIWKELRQAREKEKDAGPSVGRAEYEHQASPRSREDP